MKYYGEVAGFADGSDVDNQEFGMSAMVIDSAIS